MRFLIVESLDFTELVVDYFGDDEGLLRLQSFLLEEPTAGAVISGTGSLRKLRWVDPRRGKGKRGGLRVIYLHLPEFERLLLVDVYGKDEQDDLSPQDRKEFKLLVDEYREQLARKGKR